MCLLVLLCVSFCFCLCICAFPPCMSVSLFVRGVGHESGDLCVPCSRSQSWSPVPAGLPPRIHPNVLTHSPRIHLSDQSSSQHPRIHLRLIPSFAILCLWIYLWQPHPTSEYTPSPKLDQQHKIGIVFWSIVNTNVDQQSFVFRVDVYRLML